MSVCVYKYTKVSHNAVYGFPLVVPVYRSMNLGSRTWPEGPPNPRDSRSYGAADGPYASRSLVKRARTLRDISESTTFSLASLSSELRLLPPPAVAQRKPRYYYPISCREGTISKRNSRLTRHRPIAYQSASVCRPAGDGSCSIRRTCGSGDGAAVSAAVW